VSNQYLKKFSYGFWDNQWFGRNQIYLKLKLGAPQFMPSIKNLSGKNKIINFSNTLIYTLIPGINCRALYIRLSAVYEGGVEKFGLRNYIFF
jgi:hypothetical protein